MLIGWRLYTGTMAKDKSIYSCSDCGGTTPKWLGKCPHCGAWNSLVETCLLYTSPSPRD